MAAESELTEIMPLSQDQYRLGYIINVLLSKAACEAIAPVQDELARQFPGAIWKAQAGAAHITVIDWLTPGVDYGKDKDDLFKNLGPAYIAALNDILKNQPPITITFDRIEAYRTAVIIKGTDDGSLQRIREQFLERVDLLPGTKVQTPSFIHSTICRFTKEVDLADVRRTIAQLPINFEERIPELWLSRETKLFMQGYDVIRKFDLS